MSASSSCTSWNDEIALPNWRRSARIHAGVEAALRDSDAAGSERDAAVVEGRHRHLEALAFGAEPARVGDADAVEKHFGGVLRP